MAFKGSDATGRKGILELCNDITAALRASTLDKFLHTPITDMSVSYGRPGNRSEFLWLGTVRFSGRLYIDRRL